MTQQPADAMTEPLNCPFCDGPGRKRTGLTCQVWCYNCNFHAEFSVWQRHPSHLSAETVKKLNQAAHLLNIAACSLDPWQAVVEALELVNGILPAKPTDDGEK